LLGNIKLFFQQEYCLTVLPTGGKAAQ